MNRMAPSKVVVDPMDPKYAGDHEGSLVYLAANPPPLSAAITVAPPEVEEARYSDTWTVFIFFRLANAIALSTFFQPDEYYQALEPAWQLAFGADSGAWITWEWRHALRSSIQPVLLAGVYRAIAALSDALFTPVLRTLFLVLLPKMVMGLFAALQDYYTWRLAERIYGSKSSETTAVFAIILLSPWQWFVSTRALSNSLETTLTAMALYYWPWEWLKPAATAAARSEDRRRSIILFASNALDRFYYGEWTFPAANFLNFNLNQNLAVFYGKNRPDYYLTEGVPLLLTTYLPFGIIGLYQALFNRLATYPGSSNPPQAIMLALAITALTLPTALSFISHKEVRFIYPILPILHVLLARPVTAFFHPFPKASSIPKRFTILLIVAANFGLAAYFGLVHGRGVIAVTGFLRSEFELRNDGMVVYGETSGINHTTVGVLMPCHSIPWRSHLVYREIDAWALTCEPPLGLSEEQKTSYVDEADRFYADPLAWMEAEMGSAARPWPMYLVFFQQLEETMRKSPRNHDYFECWRGFNSHWHDDHRRKGDVVVWCQTAGAV